MSNVGNEVRVNVVVVSISSSHRITGVHSSTLKTSADQPLKDFHKQISRIDRTGLNKNGEILDFNSSETVGQLLRRQNSTRIYVFRIDASDRTEHFDLFLEGLSSLQQREHLEGSLFIHLHQVSKKKITQIISIPLTTNASITSMEILQRVRHALKADFDDGLIYHLDGQQIGMNDGRSFKGGSIITVCSPGEQFDASTDGILRRLRISLILFSRINHFNLRRFFNYCDRNKSLKLERTELETGLLTILKLFNEQLSDSSSSWPRFTFYHLFLPAESQFSISYSKTILYLAETLLQSVRLMPVDRSLDEFIEHLDRTLSDSLRLCPELSQAQTATVFGQDVCRYIVDVLASPILLFISPIRSYFLKSPRAKILRRLAIHLSSISLIISLINFIIYYIYFVSSSRANQLEVFWPLGSVLSILIILYVYEFSSFHRKRYFNGNRVEQMFECAHLEILEIRSTPNRTESIEFPFPLHYTTQLYQIAAQNPNDHHPTLLANHSISNSFLRPTGVSPLRCFHYSLYALLIFISLLSLIVHSSIPTIDRLIQPSQSSRNDQQQWSIRLNQYFYIITSLICYSTLLVLMMFSVWNYAKVLHNLQFLFLNTDLRRQGDFQSEYYFNLRRRENLEYFLHLFRRILSSIDENHLFITTMTCALLLDIGLISTVIIRVFILRYSTDLMTVWCLIDVLILSIFIMTFVVIVVLINKLILHDFIQYLRNFRRDLSTVDSIYPREANIDLDYLQFTIEHIDSVKDQYSVKLLGFLVDQSLATTLLISILTGIASAIVSFTQQE